MVLHVPLGAMAIFENCKNEVSWERNLHVSVKLAQWNIQTTCKYLIIELSYNRLDLHILLCQIVCNLEVTFAILILEEVINGLS